MHGDRVHTGINSEVFCFLHHCNKWFVKNKKTKNKKKQNKTILRKRQAKLYIYISFFPQNHCPWMRTDDKPQQRAPYQKAAVSLYLPQCLSLNASMTNLCHTKEVAIRANKGMRRQWCYMHVLHTPPHTPLCTAHRSSHFRKLVEERNITFIFVSYQLSNI